MFKGTHLNKHKFINQLLTTSNNFYFFTKSRNILSKNINISKINNNYSISSYYNNTLTNISNSIIKKKKSFSMKKINNTIIKRPSSLTKKMNSNNQSRIKSISLRNKKNFLHKYILTQIMIIATLLRQKSQQKHQQLLKDITQ